jgi:hypothetical protein
MKFEKMSDVTLPILTVPLDRRRGRVAVLRIRILDPGLVTKSGSRYFLELRNHFFGVKYLNSFMRIRDGKNSDPGWRKVGSGIRYKHPGSATQVRGTDPAPDPSVIKKKSKKSLDSNCFVVTSL